MRAKHRAANNKYLQGGCQKVNQTYHPGRYLHAVSHSYDHRACERRHAAIRGAASTHRHMVGVFPALSDLSQETLDVSRVGGAHHATVADRDAAGDRLFLRRGVVRDHRRYHHVDLHRTQHHRRHPTRRNHACTGPSHQRAVRRYATGAGNQHQPAFHQRGTQYLPIPTLVASSANHDRRGADHPPYLRYRHVLFSRRSQSAKPYTSIHYRIRLP